MLHKALLLVLLATFPVRLAVAQPRNQSVWWYEFDGDAGSSQERFWDIYQKADGGFIMAGDSHIGGMNTPGGNYVCNIDRAGGVIWAHAYSRDQWPYQDMAYSVIEMDDGGFTVGGRSGPAGGGHDHFSVIRLDEDGEVVWWNLFNQRMGGWGNCYGVIETKGGGIFAVGDAISEDGGAYPGLQYAVLISADGNAVWEYYSPEGERGQFCAVREVEDEGFVMCGTSIGDAEIVKLNQQGAPVWKRGYAHAFNSMTSCRDGGFALSSIYNEGWAIQRVDDAGNHVFRSLKRLDAPAWMLYWNGGCIAQLSDCGFAMVGHSNRNSPSVWRTDRAGNEMWWRVDHFGHPRYSEETYRSVIIGRDNSIIVAGQAYNEQRADSSYDAFIVKLVPDFGPPQIRGSRPIDHDFKVLTGDSVAFSVVAEDLQEDSIRYLWTVNDQPIGERDHITLPFNDIGDYLVRCVVSDVEVGDSAIWNVEAVDLYIEDYHPVSLNLAARRGATLEFGLDSVSAIEGAEVQYLWTLTNLLTNEAVGISDQPTASATFEFSGNYSLEGLASSGNSMDAVRWDISVRGAIWSFTPVTHSLSVHQNDSIKFAVIPFNPTTDSLQYGWFIGAGFGNRVGDDSVATIVFRDVGAVEVKSLVMDGGESDTVSWQVEVTEPDYIGGGSNSLQPAFGLAAPSPNPFNSTTSLRFSLPTASNVKLTLHDCNGREVAKLLSGALPAGEHSVKFDAGGDLAGGVYLVKLEAGGASVVVKAVLIR